MADYREMKNRTRTQSRENLPDIYKAARDLEVRSIAERAIAAAGRSSTPEFLHEVARQIADLANQRGNR